MAESGTGAALSDYWTLATRASVEATSALSATGVLRGGIGLNREQLAAIGMCLQRPPLAVVFGPPGTGKTTTLSAFLAHALCSLERPRVLVVSQTNLAADVVLERLLRLVADAAHSGTDAAHSAFGAGSARDILRVAGYMRTPQDSEREMGRTVAQAVWMLTSPTSDVSMRGLGNKRVVVTTLDTAAKWMGNAFWANTDAAHSADQERNLQSTIDALRFDYVVVDEAS